MSTSVPPSTQSTSTSSTTKKFHGFNVPAILTWRDPVKTGTLAGEAILLWIVLSSSLALRLFLRFNCYFLGLLSFLEITTRLINGSQNGLIGSYRPSRFLPREQAIQNISTSIAKNVRCAMYGVEHLLDTRSPVLNLQLAFASWFLYKVLCFISIRNLLLTAIIVTFTVPVAYLQFKPQVDQAISDLQAHLSAQQAKLEKIAHDKAGPQLEFVKKFTSNTRNRGGFPSTAEGSTDATGAHTTGASGAHTTGASTGAHTTGTSTGAHTTGVSTGAHTTGSHGAPSHTSSVPAAGAHSGAHSATGSSAPLSTEQVLNSYSEVPSLAGNVKLDQSRVGDFQADAQSLRDSIQKDKI